MIRFFVLAVTIFCIAGCWKQEGSRNSAGTQILLNPPLPENDAAISSTVEYFGKRGFKPLGRQCWHEGDAPKFMMLFAKPGNGSHASGAEISGLFAEYSGKGKKWELRARSLAFTENGTWGEAPEPMFVKLGRNQYGFIMEPGFMGQGYSKKALFLYGVTKKGFEELFRIPTYADNAGAVYDETEIYSVKVNLCQLIDDSKEHYDMKAKLVITGRYSVTPDDEFHEVFGNAREAAIGFRNGAYVVKEKNPHANK